MDNYRISYFFLFQLMFSQYSIADQSVSDNISSNRIQFALNGLNLKTPLLEKSTTNAITILGLPGKIEIHKSKSYWDIDIEATPAEWFYPGFSITTNYYRDGLTKKGLNYLVPGPYYESKAVSEIKVFDKSVKLKFGIYIGAKKSTIIQRFGKLTSTYKENIEHLHYIVNTKGESKRDIRVAFTFDNKKNIKEIKWSLESWH